MRTIPRGELNIMRTQQVPEPEQNYPLLQQYELLYQGGGCQLFFSPRFPVQDILLWDLDSADNIIIEAFPDILRAVDNRASLFLFVCREGNCPKYASFICARPKSSEVHMNQPREHARCKKPGPKDHILDDPSHETSRMGKPMETESRLVVS